MPSPHAFSPASVKPTRRTLVRSAAWTVPAVSLAVAAPAYAVSNFSCPVITSTWSWDQVPLNTTGLCGGNLKWTVQSGRVLAGSTITITVTKTQPYYEVYWMELGPTSDNVTAEWSNDTFGTSSPVVLNVVVSQELIAGNSAFVNLNCDNPTPHVSDDFDAGYTATWLLEPGEPNAVEACETTSGCVSWFNARGAYESNFQGTFTTC